MSAPRIHGHSYRGGRRRSPTYRSWMAMWDRCRRPKHPAFHRYGGRGITVCDRWRSFEAFLADMGERPEGMTLDRMDNDRGYAPENCRWATPKQQRLNVELDRIDHAGLTLTYAEWSARTGIAPNTIRQRLLHGWSVDDALTKPVARRREGANPMLTAILLLTLASGGACETFAADVARRADLMAADVETMPHVVREGLRQLAHDARARTDHEAAIDRLREELRAIIRRNRASAKEPAP